jgi:transcriptional antiterminator Rof (Rho-off)
MNKNGTPSLMEQHYEVIRAHIIDPDGSPLPPKMRDEFARVLQAARLLDEYPNVTHLLAVLQSKYSVSVGTLRHDIALARELFKTNHTFDWDFWHAWQLKDQLELIRECKLRGDLKNWNNAKKTLALLIGEKPEAVDDPRRMEKNVFYIQINHEGEKLNIDLDTMRRLSQKDRKEIIDALFEPIDESKAGEIMDT